MPRIIEFQGRRISLPDGATDDQVRQILMGGAGPAAAPAAATPSPPQQPPQPLRVDPFQGEGNHMVADEPPQMGPGRDPGAPSYGEMRNPTGVMGAVQAGLTGFNQNIPVVGPIFEDLRRRGVEAVGGPSREAQGAYLDRAAAEHPAASMAGGLAGSIAPFIPAGMTATGAKMLGITGNTLRGRAVMGGASGAAIGGADAGVRSGGDPSSAVAGALAGGLLGAGAPLVGSAIGAGAAWANRTIRGAAASVPGIRGSAANRLADAISTDSVLANPQARLSQLGPDGMLLDAGPTTRGVVAGATQAPGEARSTLLTALEGRRAGTTGRIASDLDAAIGPAVPPSQVEAGIKSARDQLSPYYRAVIRHSGPVDTAPILTRVEAQLATAKGRAAEVLASVRDLLAPNGNLDVTARGTLDARQALDGMIAAAKANPELAKGGALSLLTALRREIDGALSVVPGMKRLDAMYADLSRQIEGLNFGRDVLSVGKNAMWPQELAQEMAPMNSATRQAVAAGTAGDIRRMVGTTANDLVALRNAVRGEGDWNRAKLVEVFGQNSADRILGAVDREAAFDAAYRELVGNSLTAPRQAAQAAMEPTQIGRGTGEYVVGTAMGGVPGLAAVGAIKAGTGVINSVARALAAGRNIDIARAATMMAGPQRNALVQALLARGGLRNAPGNVAANVSRVAQALLMSQTPKADDAVQGTVQGIGRLLSR